jgi:hypothetical protein
MYFRANRCHYNILERYSSQAYFKDEELQRDVGVNEPSGLIGTTCFTAAEALSPH